MKRQLKNYFDLTSPSVLKSEKLNFCRISLFVNHLTGFENLVNQCRIFDFFKYLNIHQKGNVAIIQFHFYVSQRMSVYVAVAYRKVNIAAFMTAS